MMFATKNAVSLYGLVLSKGTFQIELVEQINQIAVGFIWVRRSNLERDGRHRCLGVNHFQGTITKYKI